MACLCVLLGGPSYAAGAESLIIEGATYFEPGVSGPGWAWTDADHLELNGYAGEAIGADGDLVVTLYGRNSVVETRATDVDISRCGMEVWGDLTLRGTGSLLATGSQRGVHVSGSLVVDGCSLDARADGAGVTDELVARGGECFAAVDAGLGADVRDGGRLAATDAEAGWGVRAYGVYLLDGTPGDGAGVGRLSVDASWLDATGAEGGVACLGGSLTAAQLVTPAGVPLAPAAWWMLAVRLRPTWWLSPRAPQHRRGRPMRANRPIPVGLLPMSQVRDRRLTPRLQQPRQPRRP